MVLFTEIAATGFVILIAWSVFVVLFLKLKNKIQHRKQLKLYDPKNDPGLIGRPGLPEEEEVKEEKKVEEKKSKHLPRVDDEQMKQLMDALKS